MRAKPVTRAQNAQIDDWAQQDDVVALHLEQRFVPVEGPGAVFFPPTFASDNENSPYCIDTLADGTKVVLVDSVGSQANRMEPIFLKDPFSDLIPQISIKYGDSHKGTDGVVSLLEVGHRLGDAVVRCTKLKDKTREAFQTLLRSGDAALLAKIGPTSLVFGVWDSRGTMAKVPRLLQATIRAWDVSELRRSAQYTPALDYAALDIFSEKEKEKAEGSASNPLARRGFVHVPSTDTHGGVIASGPIRRDVTINLVQLRRLEAHQNTDKDETSQPKARKAKARKAKASPAKARKTKASPAKTSQDRTHELRQYLLGLALVAALEPLDPFLRQGCMLVPEQGFEATWQQVLRNGTRKPFSLTPKMALEYAQGAAGKFGVGGSQSLTFDKGMAQSDIKEAKAKKK